MEYNIYIEFKDCSRDKEYISLPERFWCLWNEQYVKLFTEDAMMLMNEIAEYFVVMSFNYEWRHWDFCGLGYEIEQYIW